MTMQKLELSHQQRRGWRVRLQDRRYLATAAEVAVGGRVDRERLEAAVEAVTRRHEALRTRIEPQAGMKLPVQVVYETAGDAAASASPQEGSVSVVIADDGAAGSRVSLEAPAMLIDRYSCGVFLRDLAQAYAGVADEAEPLQYADYAAWVEESMASEDTAPGREFWSARDVTALDEFVIAVTRRATRPSKAAEVSKVLSPALVAALKKYTDATGAPVEAVFLAAWHALLYRHGCTDRVALGVGRELRPFEDLQSGIGAYHQYLPQSLVLDDSMQFAEVVSAVREDVAAIEEWQDCFSWELTSRDPDAMRYLFEFQREPEKISVDGVVFEMDGVYSHAEPFDLKLAVEETSDGETFLLTIWFDEARIDSAQAERFVPQIELLLEDALHDDSRRLARLCMTPPAEEALVTSVFNKTATEYPADAMTLVSLFENAATRYGDREAVIYEEKRITYGELKELSTRIGHALRRQYSAGPEAVVAVMMDRGLDLLPALYGILKCGAAYLPLDPDYPEERLRHIVSEAGVVCVLCDEKYLPRFSALDVDTATPASLLSQSELVHDLDLELSPEHAAYVIYTSGSTGLPKGVIIEHRAVCNLMHWLQGEYKLDTNSRMLQKTPYTFDVSVPELFWPLGVGAAVVMAKPDGHRDPGYLVEVINKAGITITNFVPTMLRVFLEHPGASSCTSLKHIICVGEALVEDLVKRFQAALPRTNCYNLYGPTEAAVYVTHWVCASPNPYGGVPIGKPFANTQMYVLNDEFRPVPVGVKGELYIGGIQVARGYVKRDDLTRERFIDDRLSDVGERLYKTGDIGRWLPDGNLAYIGRVDSQIKLRGFRVELGEIEQILSDHPSVSQCTVLAIDFSDTDRRLVAYLVPVEGCEVDVDGLRKHLAARVPEYMVPAFIEILDELPTTSSGKIDRKQLPQPVLTASSQEYVGARNAIERHIVDSWGAMLRIEKVSVHDSFFELGGDSLQAAIFCNQLSTLIDDYVSVVSIFEHDSPAEFADYLAKRYPAAVDALASPEIEAAGADEAEGIKPLADRPSSQPATAYQARTWFIDALEQQNPAYNTLVAIELRGKLDVAALRAAFHRLVERHEILRTRFLVQNGRLVQAVADLEEAPFSIVPLDSPLSGDVIERFVREEAQRRFDLAAGEVVHATLYCGTDGHNLLVLGAHQIASDAWCRELLIAEIAALYGAEVDPLAEPPPPPALQYGDFAAWNRARLAGDYGTKALEFWQSFLAGKRQLLDFPTDRPRPPVKSNRGATLRHRIPAATMRQVYDLSGSLHASSFMVLFAAFYALLERYSGQEEIVVGSTVACREREETRALMGRIANMIAVPARVDPRESFTVLLGKVRDNLLQAYQYQDYPLIDVIGHLRCPRDMSQTPLYQVVFAGETKPREAPEMPGLELKHVGADKGLAKYDLTFVVMEEGDELVAELEYATELFEEASIRRFARDFEELLGRLLTSPDVPLETLELPAAPDRLRHGGERVRLNGFPVSLEQVRNALESLEGVEQCALQVIAANGRDVLAASYTGTRTDPAEIERRLAWTLPSYMLPRAYLHVRDVRRLAAPLTAADLARDGGPPDWLEKQIIEDWAELLPADEIAPGDDFFALGGTSLLALAAAERASRLTGVPVSVRHFFECATPATLAEHVRVMRALTSASASPARQEIRI